MLTDQRALWEQEPAANPSAPFRPIHYLGSKIRLLEAIGEALDRAEPDRGPVVDLFTGSGVVAAHLAQRRDVVAVDIQEYSRVIAAALLAPARLSEARVRAIVDEARGLEAQLLTTPLRELLGHERACAISLSRGDPDPVCELLESGSALAAEHGEGPPDGPLAEALAAASSALTGTEPPTVLARLYGGVYFGYRQALGLDCLLAAVRALPADCLESGLAAVMSAASECVTSVGNHFAQPIRPRDRDGRPKLRTLLSAARRREADVFELFEMRLRGYAALGAPPRRGTAVRADYRDFLASDDVEAAAVYADPPYTRDHYSRFYHVLETIAVGDMPDLSRMCANGDSRISRGLYRPERHQSPFCIRSEVTAAFADLFAGVRRREVPLVLSYSPYTNGTAARPRPRLLTVPEVVELAGAAFSHVHVIPAGRLSHSKFNATHLNGEVSYNAEVFVVCRP